MLRRRPSPTPAAFARSPCPIACTLDLLGDKWTLIVVRDLLLGKHRFADLLASSEGISTNILAERLARLERTGLVERRRYRARPPRDEYHLTAKGRDLAPVLAEMVRWANRHVPGTFVPPPEMLSRRAAVAPRRAPRPQRAPR